MEGRRGHVEGMGKKSPVQARKKKAKRSLLLNLLLWNGTRCAKLIKSTSPFLW